MEYELVRLESKTITGLRARTSNAAPDMEAVIGMLWQRLYGGVYETIPGKVDEKSIGLYTNYEQGEDGAYDVFVGCETRPDVSSPAGTEQARIPAGRYARFVIRGDVQKAVAAFWQKLWAMPLERAFTADFEEYQPGGNERYGEIHIYISLK